MTVTTIVTPEEMTALGRRVAAELRAGDVVALDGELGAGKTTFTRGIGAALGIRGTITSPTFVLARTHLRGTGEPPLVHVDAYRLGGAAELQDLDLDLASSITVVEWAGDLLDELTDSVLSIRIDRPTGAATSGTPIGTGRGADADGTDTDTGDTDEIAAVDHDADRRRTDVDDEEPIEPRTVTISARGPAWADRAERLCTISGA